MQSYCSPILTVITITKNDELGLRRTLDSTAKLREHNIEQIVVDGGDARASRSNNGYSICFIPAPPRGIANAFNEGVSMAKGEWVWFLNGGDRMDDRLSPQFLLSLLKYTKAEIIIGGTTYEGEDEPRPFPPIVRRWPLTRPWIPHPSTIVRRRLFDKYGMFEEKYQIASDYEWLLRATLVSQQVDMLSVPFAIFAPDGISQAPHSRPTILKENSLIIRTHIFTLMCRWFEITKAIALTLVRATLRR